MVVQDIMQQTVMRQLVYMMMICVIDVVVQGIMQQIVMLKHIRNNKNYEIEFQIKLVIFVYWTGC